MLKNYLKIAWRSLLKNKGLFAINTTGLAIGIAACLVIMLFVIDELSYDRYNEKADQIVRVVLKGKVNGESIKEAVVMAPVAETLLNDFPEVEQATRLRNFGNQLVIYGNKRYRENRSAFVDPNFFDVFTLPFIKGDPSTALQEPNTIVLTEDQAKVYFGEQEPMGKVLTIDNMGGEYRVTGVIKNIPDNSHFHFDQLASMSGMAQAQSHSWMESYFFCYLVLRKGFDYKILEAKLPQVVEKNMFEQLQKALGMSFAEFREHGNDIGLFLQPLTDIHLFSDFSSATELEQGGDIKSVYIFSAIALFMLLIACINFMNLSTAGASKRGKEVGIKKVLGSKRKQLIGQFLSESMIATIIAMLIGLTLVLVTLPLFNSLSGKSLQAGFLLNPSVLFVLLILGIFISLLAGTYPAFVLSSFNPLSALSSKFSDIGNKLGIRSGLVVFQFVVSVCLIIGTLVVDQQMSFIQHKNLGYDQSQILVIRDSRFLGDKETVFKDQLLNDPRIENITMSGFVPAGPTNISMSGVYPNENSDDFRRTLYYDIDEQYLPTMGMELVKGRNFSKDFGTESNNIIINETAVKTFGLGEDVIGKVLTRAIDNEGGRESLTIIGVVKDFHFRSLHQQIEPLMLLMRPSSGLIIRANTQDMPGLISDMGILWNQMSIDEPFNYLLLDDAYHQTYLSDLTMGTLLRIFALITIFVACLGLFGLVTFTTEQRVKEIGIRKVLGSTVFQIVSMLSKDFIKLVFISFIIAFPLGYYLMDSWLEGFAYQVQIGWWIYALAGVITLLIAFLTISFNSIKSALANPVKSLRTE